MSKDAWVCLITIKSDEGSVAHIIDKPKFVLGRTRETDLPIIEASVSRKHLVVHVEGDNVFVQDQNSANGTFVNEVKIEKEVQVFPGDKIRLGSNSGEFQMIAIPRPFEMMAEDDQKHSLHTSIEEVSHQIEERMHAQLEVELSDAREAADEELGRVRAAAEREIQLARQTAEKQALSARRAAETELEQARLTIEQLEMQQKKDQELMRTQMANDNVNRRQQLETEIAQLRQQALIKVGEEMLRGRKEADRLVTEAQKRIQQDLEASSKQADIRLSEAQDASVKLLESAGVQGRSIVAEAHEEAAKIRLAANDEARDVQQEANRKANEALVTLREKLQREMQEKRNAILAQAETDTSRERERLAQEKAAQKEALQIMIKGYDDRAALLRTEVETIEQEKTALAKDVKALGEEFDLAKKLLAQVEELEGRKSKSDQDLKQLALDLENEKTRFEKEQTDNKERLLVDYETRKKAHENDLAKEKLKGLQDIKALIQAEEQKYTQGLRLRAVELTQVLTERFLPKLDEWIAQPDNARIHMGTEIDAIVAQSLLNEGSAIRLGQSAPEPEKIENRKKLIWRVSTGGGIMALIGLYLSWGSIYPVIERLSGNGYAAKIIEDRRIQSLFVPPQTDEFRATYTDNVVYMKDYYQIKTDPKYIEQWTLKLNNLELLKPMGLSEEAVVKYVAKEAAMIQRLGALRNSIDKVYLDEGLNRMKEVESEDLSEIKTILGGDSNFNRIRKMEQASIHDFQQNQ